MNRTATPSSHGPTPSSNLGKCWTCPTSGTWLSGPGRTTGEGQPGSQSRDLSRTVGHRELVQLSTTVTCSPAVRKEVKAQRGQGVIQTLHNRNEATRKSEAPPGFAERFLVGVYDRQMKPVKWRRQDLNPLPTVTHGPGSDQLSYAAR